MSDKPVAPPRSPPPAPTSPSPQPALMPVPKSDRPMTEGDAKDVLEFTLDRLKQKNQETIAALKDSTQRLLDESEAARDTMRRLSHPPEK